MPDGHIHRHTKMSYDQLKRIANATGGGLSTEITGRYTSVRHEQARQSGDKMTAGEAAKRIRKQGHKVTAKELIALYRLIHGREPEWHHAGFIPGQGRMGRTFFFRSDDLEVLAANIAQAETLRREREKQAQVEVIGIAWRWKPSTGQYGRKIWTKELVAYRGPKAQAPANMIYCDQATWERAKAQEGRIYIGKDEPLLRDFAAS